MTRTVRGKASNPTARWMRPSSPNTKVGGSGAGSLYSLAMISGPIPHGSPMVIASGTSSSLGILFNFHQCISHRCGAAKAASLCDQRQGTFTQESHDGNACLHLAKDFEGLRSQSSAERIGCVAARGNDSADAAFAHQLSPCMRKRVDDALRNLSRRQIQ